LTRVQDAHTLRAPICLPCVPEIQGGFPHTLATIIVASPYRPEIHGCAADPALGFACRNRDIHAFGRGFAGSSFRAAPLSETPVASLSFRRDGMIAAPDLLFN
jgi:hypothetical protein